MGPLAARSLTDMLSVGDMRLYCGKTAILRKVNGIQMLLCPMVLMAGDVVCSRGYFEKQLADD